jgi:large subunit ribosomal protein L15
MTDAILTLHSLKNTHRPSKARKLLGRGPGSHHGKTCGRGHKGAGSRSGYKARHGKEGGGVPLHKRVPTRGFSNAQFSKRLDVINLGQIEALYNNGETVSLDTLREKGYLTGPSNGIKILGSGTLTKKVQFDVSSLSESVKQKISHGK